MLSRDLERGLIGGIADHLAAAEDERRALVINPAEPVCQDDPATRVRLVQEEQELLLRLGSAAQIEALARQPLSDRLPTHGEVCLADTSLAHLSIAVQEPDTLAPVRAVLRAGQRRDDQRPTHKQLLDIIVFLHDARVNAIRPEFETARKLDARGCAIPAVEQFFEFRRERGPNRNDRRRFGQKLFQELEVFIGIVVVEGVGHSVLQGMMMHTLHGDMGGRCRVGLKRGRQAKRPVPRHRPLYIGRRVDLARRHTGRAARTREIKADGGSWRHDTPLIGFI